MVAYKIVAGRDRRARSVSSSLDRCSPNSVCHRRSPRPLEFRADLLRIPSILYMRRPRSILTEPLDHLNLSVSILAQSVNVSGTGISLGRRMSIRLSRPKRTSSSKPFADLGTLPPLGRAAGSSAFLFPSESQFFFQCQAAGPPHPLVRGRV